MSNPDKKGVVRHALLMALALLTSLSVKAKVPDNWNVDGENGVIYVRGALVEGACDLDVHSIYQEIDLGTTTSAKLLKPGDQGVPVAVTIRLNHCIRIQGSVFDPETNHFATSPHQPVVAVKFTSVADSDNPDLVRVNGITGMGLRILNSQHDYVYLEREDTPQFLNEGRDELAYYIIPERTAAPLTPGNYHAVINFSLSYD
ncbi:fimbrial protein [Dryocola sp. BD626]|jgi:fimbrial protein|uniref:fimbrial protein n=1 Tax=Dryocola sp. BD626 TaxID=3133273 RepID=UPI003F50AB6A